MPVYKFACSKCLISIRQLVQTNHIERFLCECGGYMERQIPTSTSTVTKELKDAHRGVSHTKGLKQQMTKRMNEHHDRYEVEGKIDEHGTIDAKKFGWDKKVKR